MTFHVCLAAVDTGLLCSFAFLKKLVSVSNSLSLLLDSVLCALAPLTFLTAAIPELGSCTQHALVSASSTHCCYVYRVALCADVQATECHR